MRNFVVIIPLILLIGIIYGAKGVPKVSKEPEVLTVQGECTIYKMYDKGNRIYFSKCLDGTEMPISNK